MSVLNVSTDHNVKTKVKTKVKTQVETTLSMYMAEARKPWKYDKVDRHGTLWYHKWYCWTYRWYPSNKDSRHYIFLVTNWNK